LLQRFDKLYTTYQRHLYIQQQQVNLIVRHIR
jgi:hypothetical protein